MFGAIIYAEGDYTHDCRDIMLMVDGKYIPYDERGKYPNAQKSWRAEGLAPLAYPSHTLGPLLALMGDRVHSAVGFKRRVQNRPRVGLHRPGSRVAPNR